MNPFAGILTVANPWWLIGIPLSGMALLAVYRKRSKGVRILVPSTFIWQQLAMDIQAPKKRFLPLRFLFDWLLCSLLCIAVAEVTLVQSHQDGVLIIDNSLSSFAIIPGVHGNKHVIDTIKDAAKETIRTNNSLRWSIYSTADQIQPLGTENLSASEALAIVDTVTAQYVNDEIERLFQNIRIKSPRAKVFVVTDRPLRGQALVPQQASEVITVRDNTLIWSNLALQSLALTPTADGQGQMIRARIRSYSSKTLPIEVFLKRSDRLTIPLEKKTASVPALGEVQVELPLTSITSGGFLVGFESTDARFQQNDQIAEDNTAWFAYTNVLPKISVVSPLSLKQLGLEALSAYTFVTTTLEELTKNPPEESLRAIIHR
ncbi:MAG: hypothetical protein KDD62_07860, partial [Bdellovibrionales bacterium]|nr:hypothetical protein [Bdellovibrionales bacterium]